MPPDGWGLRMERAPLTEACSLHRDGGAVQDKLLSHSAHTWPPHRRRHSSEHLGA